MLVEKGGRMDAVSSTVRISCLEGRMRENLERGRTLLVSQAPVVLLRPAEYLRRKGYEVVKCVSSSWDNTVRRQEKGARGCLNATLALCGKFHCADVKVSVAAGLLGDGILYIDAWDEWAMDAHLGPDEKNGHAWLRFMKNAQNTLFPAL